MWFILKMILTLISKKCIKNIPLLYWVSKQYKNPYKFRLIAGETNFTTKTLSVQLLWP